MNVRAKSSLVLVLWLPMGCSTEKRAASTPSPAPATPAGCLNLVVNGKPTSEYPAVIRLLRNEGNNAVGICTGTFISPTAVLTAAHCIDSSPSGGVYLIAKESVEFRDRDVFAGGTASLKAFTLGAVDGTGDPNDTSVTSKDTAVLLFPDNIATAYVALSGAKAPNRSTVTTVGYGLTTLSNVSKDPNFNATKRVGTTTIFPTTDTLNISVGGVTAAQSAAANGSEAINSFGDSGGPLFYNDKVIGILSSGGEATTQSGSKIWITTFVDVTSANTKALIALANSGGANIPAPDSTPTLTGAAKNSATAATPGAAVCPTTK